MDMLIITCLLCAVSAAPDTVPSRPLNDGGPTIVASQLGLRAVPRDRALSTRARQMDGQLTGGLIGAALLGVPMLLLAIEFNNDTDSNGSASPLITGLMAASLGFVVGVLIAGPESDK